MTVIDAINDTIKALTNLSKVLVEVGVTKGIPATEAVTATEKTIAAAPNEKQLEETVTLEQIRAVLAEKSQSGLTSKVKTLLESFGANKLSAVKPEDYASLMAAAKELN